MRSRDPPRDLVQGDYERHCAERGIDVASLRGAGNALPYTPVTQHAWRTAVPEEAYSTTYLADRAVESLGRYAASQDPFLLVLSFPDPHHPFTPPGRYWGMYDPADMPVPDTFDGPHPGVMRHHEAAREARGEHATGGPIAYSPNEAQLRHSMAAEFGMMSMLDDAIGRDLGELDRRGLADDTVVVFTSDHGDMMGDHGLIFKVGSHWDGCVRVPLVIRAPGRPGRRHTALGSRLRMRTVVTDGARLTWYRESGRHELYRTADDPDQSVNLWDDPGAAALRGEMVERLVAVMADHADDGPLAREIA
ncbi:MAG: sulfatase family protein [Dermatophilaceae bacterium]